MNCTRPGSATASMVRIRRPRLLKRSVRLHRSDHDRTAGDRDLQRASLRRIAVSEQQPDRSVRISAIRSPGPMASTLSAPALRFKYASGTISFAVSSAASCSLAPSPTCSSDAPAAPGDATCSAANPGPPTAASAISCMPVLRAQRTERHRSRLRREEPLSAFVQDDWKVSSSLTLIWAFVGNTTAAIATSTATLPTLAQPDCRPSPSRRPVRLLRVRSGRLRRAGELHGPLPDAARRRSGLNRNLPVAPARR